MGLGKKSDRPTGLFLSIAGGALWNPKADETDPDFETQTYKGKNDAGEVVDKTRKGAMYPDVCGKVVGVRFNKHPQYGESIYITLEDEGERFILSTKSDQRNGEHLMRALLICDLQKALFVKPYDFKDKKNNKRIFGVSFRQDGEKINLNDLEIIDDNGAIFHKDEEWWKNADERNIKRYYEDRNYFINLMVKNRIVPMFEAEGGNTQQGDERQETRQERTEAPAETRQQPAAATSQPATVPPLKMKKHLTAYIAENYPGESLPSTLTREDLEKWYNLSLAFEELPFGGAAEAGPDNINDAIDQSGESIEDEINSMFPDGDDEDLPF